MVKSRYSAGFYFNLSFFLLFIGGLTTLIFSPFGLEENKKIPVPNILIAGILDIILIYALYRDSRKWPVYIIWPDEIIIRKYLSTTVSIRRENIREITLFASANLWGRPDIVTELLLENGEKVIVYDFFYRNRVEIKAALRDYFGEKTNQQSNISKNISGDSFVDEKFSGHPVLNMNTLIYSAVIIACLFISLYKDFSSSSGWIVCILFMSFIYWVMAYQSHYFILGAEFLTVKNHFFPWVNRKIPVDQINCIFIENHPKLSDALRVCKKDFKTYRFHAGSLREKNWSGLISKFAELGIPRINYPE